MAYDCGIALDNRYTSHVTTMFTYQTPICHALLGVQKRHFSNAPDDTSPKHANKLEEEKAQQMLR